MNRLKIKQITLLLILTTLITASWGCSTVGANVGNQAPDFTVTTLDGKTVRLNDLRGQSVILNFWATSCGWCRYQMPFLQAAYEEKGHEIEFIGINLRESSNKVQEYITSEGIEFTIALDSNGAVASSYQIGSIPVTLYIDKHGIIQYKRPGAFQSSDHLMAVLEELQDQ